MSQQAAAGRGGGPGGGRSGGRGRLRHYPQGGVDTTKAFKSAISEIAEDTFNTGQNKFAAQFTQSRKNVLNYLQRTLAYKGYLVDKTVRTGKKQIIKLLPAVAVYYFCSSVCLLISLLVHYVCPFLGLTRFAQQ